MQVWVVHHCLLLGHVGEGTAGRTRSMCAASNNMYHSYGTLLGVMAVWGGAGGKPLAVLLAGVMLG